MKQMAILAFKRLTYFTLFKLQKVLFKIQGGKLHKDG